MMTSQDLIIASSVQSGGHLGSPSWISGFVQNLKTGQDRLKKKFKQTKTSYNDLKTNKMLQESFCLSEIEFLKKKRAGRNMVSMKTSSHVDSDMSYQVLAR